MFASHLSLVVSSGVKLIKSVVDEGQYEAHLPNSVQCYKCSSVLYACTSHVFNGLRPDSMHAKYTADTEAAAIHRPPSVRRSFVFAVHHTSRGIAPRVVERCK
jgi:hypothetical protein